MSRVKSWLMRLIGITVIIGGLVTIHEFGHFLGAKAYNVGASRFSVGFGPVVASTYIGETEFAISAIPLGGYVMMVNGPPEELWTAEELAALKERSPATYEMLYDEDRWLSNASPAEQFIIFVAGPAFNFFFVMLSFVLLKRAIGTGKITQNPFDLITVSKSGFVGPIGIFKVAALSFEKSRWLAFLYAALLSHSLGILNLLPIPLLDGSHALRALIEGFRAGMGPKMVVLLAATVFCYITSVRMLHALMRSVAVQGRIKSLKAQMGGTLQGTYLVFGPDGTSTAVTTDSPESYIEKGYLVLPAKDYDVEFEDSAADTDEGSASESNAESPDPPSDVDESRDSAP